MALASLGAALADERLPGGAATSLETPDRQAFSRPSATLSVERRLDFKAGNGIFLEPWFPAPGSTRSSDGLGPLYNARACQDCHVWNGRGRPPSVDKAQENAVSLLIRLGIPRGERTATPDPIYGRQLQDFSIAGVPGEGRPRVTWTEESVTLADGTVVTLRRPDWSISHLGYGPLDPRTLLSPRIAPPMIGLGLLEAVPEAVLAEYADPEDSDGDGVSGRLATVINAETSERQVGRFGWKASQPTLRQQAADAFSRDMGLSTPALRDGSGECTSAQTACRAAPNGAGPAGVEVSDTMLTTVAFYSRHLAVPARRNADHPEVVRGERVFTSVGCGSCHRPSLVTGTDGVDPALAGQTIWPFSDLLLHDMGDDLADGLPEGSATGREWRTPPLWGIGLNETVNGHTFFLHDGRARSVLEAILWHDGEAQEARDRVAALPTEDREALLAYVNSL